MLSKRIIPCLDVKNGRVVKGRNFLNLKDAGDPIELAKSYNELADELVFLDITATNEKRKTVVKLVKSVAKEIFIPFTIGGGIKSVEDIRELLLAGADKVAINSAALSNPELISNVSRVFGSQCIVVAIDVKKIDNEYYVFSNSGTVNTNLLLTDWVKEVELLGAGEILLTSMDADGMKQGFDLELYSLVKELNIPVIASGGAGSIEDFVYLFKSTNVDAGLAASIFHYGEIEIQELKQCLKQKGVIVRI
ncbi:MAG: imidazole glycerol phosphate synthase subunit HisF [Candidatus Heimdallarchaeota archaeon]|nr:imidazole glycerol phosphate synthase subunit HisF [Candidatus Heimdallarchaeota archaeon]